MARSLSGSWINNYLLYTAKVESPEAFHLWTAVSLIAAVLDRRVYVDQGFWKIWPNQWIVLVGTSQCGKTTAIDIGRALIEDLPDDVKPNLIAQSTSRSKLIDRLRPKTKFKMTGALSGNCGNTSSGYLISGELSSLITKQAKNDSFVPTLIDLYDCPSRWTYETWVHDEQPLYDVYMNILAATAPQYLRATLPFNEIGGGALARIMFVYQERSTRPRNARPTLSEEEKELKENLIKDLAQIALLEGECKLAPEAEDLFTTWYETYDLGEYSEEESYYFDKKFKSHILKLATIISISEGDSLIITKHNLRTARAILEQNELQLPKVYTLLISSDTGFNTMKVLKVIEDIYKVGKKATISAITYTMMKYMDKSDIDKCLQTLATAQEIRLVTPSESGTFQYYIPVKLEKELRKRK
jgi:hypothetical protein